MPWMIDPQPSAGAGYSVQWVTVPSGAGGPVACLPAPDPIIPESMGTMRSKVMRQLPVLVSLAALAGCATATDGPPEIRVDHSTCAHCTMLISEPRYAAAYRVGGTDKTFDDVGCLLTSLAAEDAGAEVEVWFRDVRDGAWIRAADALFAHDDSLRTPMAGGIVATADAAEVERLVAELGATPYSSFGELRTADARFADHAQRVRER